MRLIGEVTDNTPGSLEYGDYRGYVAIDADTGEWLANITDTERAALPLSGRMHSDEYHDLRADLSDPAPVGAVEIAARLGVARSTVDQWRQRDLFPEPRWTVGGRPAWAWADIETWAKGTGRIKEETS